MELRTLSCREVGCWEYAAEERSWTFGLFFVFGRQRHDEVLIALGGGGGVLLKKFSLVLGRAAWEAYSATWILGTDSAFAVGPRKTTQYLRRVGRSQNLGLRTYLYPVADLKNMSRIGSPDVYS